MPLSTFFQLHPVTAQIFMHFLNFSTDRLGYGREVSKKPNLRLESICKYIFSSTEHGVLRLKYCDSSVSVINFLACVRSSGHIFSLIVMKLGQNVYLD